MSIPEFTAQVSLYRTSNRYRSSGSECGDLQSGESIVPSDQAYGTINPTFSITDFVKFSPDFLGRYNDSLGLYNVRDCCTNCLASFPCADESCRRQRLFNCSRKCNAEVIGGCGCPPGRSVCEGLCCGPGEVCTLTGCSPPNQVCNNRGGCLGRCLPEGCCPPHRTVCNNHCCEYGWSCTSEGCCPPGVCCESTACPPGKFCCGGKICCSDGADCRLVHGTTEYGCFS
jgi:hypothetical protein